jgi:Protein of unknown function (DUF1524)
LLFELTGNQPVNAVGYRFDSVAVKEPTFTIEHILPERFAGNWSAEFSEEQGERFLYRLGNLTLLERELNRSLGQKGFVIKQAAYQKSIYALIRDINEVEWSPVAIAERQAQLADRAVETWRLDY